MKNPIGKPGVVGEGDVSFYNLRQAAKDCSSVLNLFKRELTTLEMIPLAKGLNFYPIRHFILFETVLYVNKFAWNLKPHNHYYQDVCEDTLQAKDSSMISEPSMDMGFQDMCMVHNIKDLYTESVMSQEAAETPPVVALFRLRSDFYPINSRGKALDLFQKSVEK